MVGIARLVRKVLPRPACDHHWHAVEKGWRCCCCPQTASAKRAAPEPGTADCAHPPDPDSFLTWLPEDRPVRRVRRGGHRRRHAA